MKELTIMGIIQGGIEKAIKYLIPILVNTLVGILLCWVPYINIGIIICFATGLPAKIARDEPIAMTEVLKPEYRKHMGNFFIGCGLMAMAIGMGYLLFIFPAIILSLSWCIALILIVDKEKNPMEALTLSNELTMGKKWTIFLGVFLINLALGIGSGIILAIGGLIGRIPFIGSLIFAVIAVAVYAFIISANICAQSVIYGSLTQEEKPSGQ